MKKLSVEADDVIIALKIFMTWEYFILISMIDERDQELVYLIMSYPNTSLRKETYWFYSSIVLITILSLIKVIDNESIKTKALADTN